MTPEAPAPTSALASGRVAAWLAKQVEIALADAALSLPQYRVLALLADGSAASSFLAERLAVRPPTITAVVDGLVLRGLVDRRHTDEDRRRVDHLLTADGKDLLAGADEAVNARLSRLASRLGDEALAARAIDDLALWGQAMRAHRSSGEAGRAAAGRGEAGPSPAVVRPAAPIRAVVAANRAVVATALVTAPASRPAAGRHS